MTTRWARLRGRYRDLFPRWARERGYVAVLTALLMSTLMGLAAFAVDVGNWYMVGQQEQAAADAAVMAGVTYLPGDPVNAKLTALAYSKANDFEHGPNSTTVTATQEGSGTRLRVSIDRTVTNFFGSLLGMSTTKVGRSAVADFAAPVVMGSPCNEFGNDPDPATSRSTNCAGVLGAFWANINSYHSDKVNGDAYQGLDCPASGVDGCDTTASPPNIDYKTDGYYYTVSVKQAMTNLKIELFDPVFVNQGLTCQNSASIFGDDGGWRGSDTRSTSARNSVVTDEDVRYRPNDSGSSGWNGSDPYYSPYCTGDALLSGTQVMNTQFTVRAPGTSSWDPATFPIVQANQTTEGVICQRVYPGYKGLLFDVLDQVGNSSYNVASPGVTTDRTIVDGFRRWTTLCTIANPVVGDYLIQVKTNGLSTAVDNADASNHFAMRATAGAAGGGSADKNFLSISGREKMGIYVNAPEAVTGFYLARIPSTAKGQTLRVRLFDVGDSSGTGTLKIIAPDGSNYDNCVGTLSTNASVSLGTTCSLSISNTTHNGKWQSIAVPIPSTYSCADATATACWVKLQYSYGSGNQPNDVTSWTASMDGDPVRLIE
jgi:hypothetical protein